MNASPGCYDVHMWTCCADILFIHLPNGLCNRSTCEFLSLIQEWRGYSLEPRTMFTCAMSLSLVSCFHKRNRDKQKFSELADLC